MNKKILRIFLMTLFMFVIFNVNKVFGIGIVSQAWKQDVDGDGRPDLIFRTYTTAHESREKIYHETVSSDIVEDGQWQYDYQGTKYTSKWIDTSDIGFSAPGGDQYATLGFVFHTEQIGDYSKVPEEDDSLYSFMGYNLPNNQIGQWIDTIQSAYTNSTQLYTKPSVANTYDSVKILELMRANGTYSDISWGTGLKVTDLTQGKKSELRYCLVNLTGNYNVYVADNVIYADDLDTLIVSAKEKMQESFNNRLWVSNIMVSQTRYWTGGYEVSRTADDFINKQYDKQIISWGTGSDYFWDSSTRGKTTTDKGMGSVLNLYDNELIVPQSSKRTVLVRHINVGSNTTISTNIIANSSRIASTDLTFTADNPVETITGSSTSTTYSGYEEYYEKAINIDRGVSKNALPDTNYYKCLGYNIAVSTDLDQAESSIATQIESGKYNTGTTATAVAKPVTSDSDYVVIDFYYTEYEKDVYVNHLYVDQNGYVKSIDKQLIVPNEQATMNKTPINRINSDTYISEIYEKKLGYNVITKNATSLADEIASGTVVYKGHEVFTQQTATKDLVNTQRTGLKSSDSVTLTSTNIQVNYYYYKETEVEEAAPKPELEGEVFVNAASNKDLAENNKNLSTTCLDTEQNNYSTISIPSGTSGKVGIKGIPKAIVAAINTKYVSPAETLHTMNFKVNFTMGDQKKTISFKDINYRVGYYIITDLSVYQLKNTTIYDAGKGYDGTLGKSLFNWSDGKLNITHNNSTVKLTGINDRTIANNASAIDRISNYVAVSVTDKDGRTSEAENVGSALDIVYLTPEQLADVDANGDGAVTNADKTYADNMLANYDKTLKEKQGLEEDANDAYDDAVKARQDLLDAWNAAIVENDRLYDIYQDKEEKKTEQLGSIGGLEGDIKTLENEILDLDTALKSLKEEEKTKLTEKNNAEQELSNADTTKNKLYTAWQNEITTRNDLKNKAECTDSVDEDVYIYLEQYEKDALEQCKKYKEDYQKNLTDQVVEKAGWAYDEASTQYNEALNKATEAGDAYDAVVTSISTTNSELDKKNGELNTKNGLLDIANRKYDKFIKDEYTPAKEAYTTYNTVTLPAAETAYQKHIDDKVVENAQEVWKDSQAATKEAQSNYDSYDKIRNKVYDKYDRYEALYREYISLNESTAAETRELKLNISVKNMSAKVDNVSLFVSNQNTTSQSYDIKDLINNGSEAQLTTNRPDINPDLYINGIGNMLEESNYTNSNEIAKDKLNGISVLAGKAEYELTKLIGNKENTETKDNIYYAAQSNNDKTVTFKVKQSKLTKNYKVNNKVTDTDAKYKETKPVNIYTPITVSAELQSDTNQIINQTTNENLQQSIIQINTPFTIKLSNDAKANKYGINDTNRFSLGYYVKFGFDVHKVKINGKTYNNGNRIAADTWIGFIPEIGETTITAQAYANLENDTMDVVTEDNSWYKVRAVAYNATQAMRNASTMYDSLNDMRRDGSELKSVVNNICANPSYFAETTEQTVIIVNRAYDFKVTDVKDVNWKSVFRTTSDSKTNKHTGMVYYSGTTKWNTESEKSNSIVLRTSSEMGRNPQRILPIGPYKSAISTYIMAPKIGYRFSFDMKVTGSYYKQEKIDGKLQNVPRDNKKVEIATRFYYISKDGATYKPEVNEEKYNTKAGIYLFYKTSNGKYVRIDGNGGGYSLDFTPNDGYRYIEDSATNTLAKTPVGLGNLRNLTLKYNMATVSNNGATITYYGEYKLPNSTIAVEVNKDGTYDINKPLTNGYIGVIFDITAYSGTAKLEDKMEDVLLSYSKNTKDKDNTSQWDYEGFLGYRNYGYKVQKNNQIKMKLEKGIWSITDDVYNDIKGSVMLYDIDRRAATDYE